MAFFQNGKTCFCLPGIKSFRQQITQSEQNIMDKALAIRLKNTKHLYDTVTKENPNYRLVFLAVSKK